MRLSSWATRSKYERTSSFTPSITRPPERESNLSIIPAKGRARLEGVGDGALSTLPHPVYRNRRPETAAVVRHAAAGPGATQPGDATVKHWARFVVGACALVALGVMMLPNGASGGQGAPKVGDKAPAFEAKDESGKLWK